VKKSTLFEIILMPEKNITYEEAVRAINIDFKGFEARSA
jgi:hypothetical protein